MKVSKNSLENLKKAKRFTKTNQPKNRGRKPSTFKNVMKGLDKVGETISLEDFNKIVKVLLTINVKALKKIAIGKETPIAIVMIASAIAGDIENKQLGNLDRLMDRVFGRAVQKQELTGKDGKDLNPNIVIEFIDSSEKVDHEDTGS